MIAGRTAPCLSRTLLLTLDCLRSQARVIGSASSKSEEEDEEEQMTRSETEPVVEQAVRPVMTPALNAEVRARCPAYHHRF